MKEALHEVVFFFKQKTAYEMRISDWSSDVCSSDLAIIALTESGYTPLIMSRIRSSVPIYAFSPHRETQARAAMFRGVYTVPLDPAALQPGEEIGRAPCGERGCQYGATSGVAVSSTPQNPLSHDGSHIHNEYS